MGGNIISIDPLYGFSPSTIALRINETCDKVIEQTTNNYHMFKWDKIPNVMHLKSIRMAAMNYFLEDFTHNRNHYVTGALPNLPFAASSFDLALCSHYLFLYSEQFSADFHIQAIYDLCRVAHEVGIFPLVDLEGNVSPHLDLIIHELGKRFQIHKVKVDYEFQKNADTMLKISPQNN